MILIWSNRYLPMVDLPQHAAQLSGWIHHADPAYGFFEQFELNYRTPYLAAFSIARLLSDLGVVTALKIVISIAVLGYPLALLLLLRRFGHDCWWSLVGFAVAFGFPFYFGFVAFLLAVPLYLLAVACAFFHAERRSVLSAACLAGLTTAIFFVHGFVYLVTMTTCGLVSLFTRGTWRQRLLQLCPYGVAALIGGLWTVSFLQTGARAGEVEEIWRLGIGRVGDLPGLMLGLGAGDLLASAAGLGLLAAPFLSRFPFCREPRRYIPLIVVLAGALFFPHTLRGVAYLAPRLAILVLPALLLALDSPRSARPQELPHRGVVVAIVGIWLALLTARFHGFDKEARSFDRVLAQLEPNRRVRPLIFASTSPHIPGGAVYLHFLGYYQALKGGYLGFSFARYSTSFVRYRPSIDAGMPAGHEWIPDRFVWETEGRKYDYFVVRARTDRSAQLFGAAKASVSVVGRYDSWWVYKRLGAPASGAPRVHSSAERRFKSKRFKSGTRSPSSLPNPATSATVYIGRPLTSS